MGEIDTSHGFEMPSPCRLCREGIQGRLHHMTRMNPLQLRKAGAIIENMQGAGFQDDDINHVCQVSTGLQQRYD